VIHFFGHHVYDRHGWPRVQETPGETPGCTIAKGELPVAAVAELFQAVLLSPATGMASDYSYRIDDLPERLPPRPRRKRRR
jgi:hypothetical protein